MAAEPVGQDHRRAQPGDRGSIGTVAHADRADLDEALEAAAKGFKIWRAVSPFDRCKIMRKAAAIMRERNDEIAPLMTMEQGKTLAEAKIEAMLAADVIEWFAEEAKRAYGRVIPARGPGIYQIAIKEPVGPVAAFTPWNFPINQVVRKLSARSLPAARSSSRRPKKPRPRRRN